jgi:hypothetical protein
VIASGRVRLGGDQQVQSLFLDKADPGTQALDLAGRAVHLVDASMAPRGLEGHLLANRGGPADGTYDSTETPGTSVGIAFGTGLPFLMRLTVDGDANVDGRADVTDLGLLATNFNNPQGGGWTVTGGVIFDGGDGADMLNLFDQNHAADADYGVHSGHVSRTPYDPPPAFGGVAHGRIERVNLFAGSGDDTIAINEFTSGVAPMIWGGAGDDVLSLGNGDVRNNITSIGPFTFDGQDGYDTFRVLSDDPGTEPFRYSRERTFFHIANVAGGYAFRVQDPNVELTDVRARGGFSREYMEVLAMRPGTELHADMGSGVDTLLLGGSDILPSANTVDPIDGTIRYKGGDGGGGWRSTTSRT